MFSEHRDSGISSHAVDILSYILCGEGCAVFYTICFKICLLML